MIHYGVWLLGLVIVLSGCGHKTPEEQIEAAKRAQQQGDHKTAIVEFKAVLQKQPGNGEARLLLAQSLYSTGELASAEMEFKKAGELGAPADKLTPLYCKVLLAMGKNQRVIDEIKPSPTLSTASQAAVQICRFYAYQLLKQPGEAARALADAETAGPEHPDVILAKARLALSDGNTDKALQWIDEALKRDPKHLDSLYTKAGLLGQIGKSDLAMKVYQEIIANDSKQINAYLSMSSLHAQAKNLEAAEKAIQSAEKLAGNAPMVKYARGFLELQRGKLKEASAALLEVLRVVPDHQPSELAFAMASYGLGHFEQSLKAAGKVFRADPDNLDAAKIFAGSQLNLGDVTGAQKTLAPLLIKHAGDAKLLALAGEVSLQAKDFNNAMGYLDKAAGLKPESADIRTRQAAGHLAMGNSHQALADLEAAVSLGDKLGQADLSLVMVHLNSKSYDKALQAIASLEKKLPNNPVTYNLRAGALLGKQDRAGARKALEQALVIEPGFIPAAINLARLDVQDKKPEAARKRFETILASDKSNVKVMLALAELAAAEKKEEDYVNWLEKATKADPKALPAHKALVGHYLARKENAKALALAKQAASASPENLSAQNLLGATQIATGDKEASMSTFTQMTKQAPQSPEAQLGLALAQIANKQLPVARNTLKAVLQLKPDFLKAQDALMRLEMTDNKPEAALNIAHQIQTQQPKSPLGFEREADILMSQKRYPQAIKAYEQALTNVGDSAVLIKLHSAMHVSGDAKLAEQRLYAGLKQHPKDSVLRNYAAEYFMANHRERDAIAQYEEVLKLTPGNLAALNNLANLYQRVKDGRALSIAEQAFKQAPDHPGVQDTVGWILLENGQLPRALELLSRAVTNAPKLGGVRYHYGVALARAGKKTEARKELEAAIASGQKFPELDDAKTILRTL